MNTSIRNSILVSGIIFILAGLILTSCNKSADINDSSTPAVNNPPLSYFSLFPDTLVAAAGNTVSLTIIARDTSGADIPDIMPAYSSSDENVVSIQPDGRISANAAGLATLTASAGGKTAKVLIHVGPADYDLKNLGVPKILNANHIDLSKIGRISRFRSTVGHSYTDSDSTETCRSMKHYFEPKSSVDWTNVDIYSPLTGTITGLQTDGHWGYQVRITSVDQPVFFVAIFHVNIDSGIVKGKWIHAGDHLGKHASSFTMSDIAVTYKGKDNGHLVSFFEAITNPVFALYQARGVPSREAAIITKEERDADPVPCVGEEQFTVEGTIPDWLVLN
jgi:hypothetical protein